MGKVKAVPMGESVFFSWHDMDAFCDQWGKQYFGEHVQSYAGRDGTECYLLLRNLREDDREKFNALFDRFDRDHDFEPEADFCSDGIFESGLPTCVTAGLLAEAMGRPVGTLFSMEIGVFVMEQELDWFDLSRNAVGISALRSREIMQDDGWNQESVAARIGLASSMGQVLGAKSVVKPPEMEK